MSWIRILPLAECPLGRPRYVETNGHELAVFHLDKPQRIIVIRNTCPHAGGNLAAGQVDQDSVTCPWHQWKFNLDDGACTLSPQVKLRRYESKIEDGFVCVRLGDD